MKTSSLIIGVADETPNRNMVETLFSQYLSLDINNPQEPQVQIDTTDVSILLLSLDRIVERVMSGDMSCGIASIGQLRKKMEARGKVPLLDL